MLEGCGSLVGLRGGLILNLRMTDKARVFHILRSHKEICFESSQVKKIAKYSVFNFVDCLSMLGTLPKIEERYMLLLTTDYPQQKRLRLSNSFVWQFFAVT